MIIAGLTGSMAMGKTTAANMLREMDGVSVLCSDDVVRGLYEDRTVIDWIRRRFPASFDAKSQAIDKKVLLSELERDHEKWSDLESMLHPLVQAAQKKFIAEQRRIGTAIAVLDIPLLFETGAEKRVDYTICVSAPPFIQAQRIAERVRAGRLTEEDAAFRLSRQMPDAEKRARADFVVQSGNGLPPMRQALEKIVADLKGRDRRPRRFPSCGL